MTLKEFLEKDWKAMSLEEVYNTFKSNKIKINTFLDYELYPCAMEFYFDGIEDAKDIDGFIHIFTSDEVVEDGKNDGDDYDILGSLIQSGLWGEVDEYIHSFYIGLTDENGKYLLNWKDFGISDNECDNLNSRAEDEEDEE